LPLAASATALEPAWQTRFRRLAGWALEDEQIIIVMDNN
jgi:hypothetical protein